MSLGRRIRQVFRGGDLSGAAPNPKVIGLNNVLLSGLATGLVKNTTATGVPSIATANDISSPVAAVDAGANDTYTATLSPAPAAYVDGVHYRFKANTANTGAATINFNGLGAKTIKKVAGGVTTDLADNDIRAGQWVDLVYDGTNMQMQSTLGNAATSLTQEQVEDIVGAMITAGDDIDVTYDDGAGTVTIDNTAGGGGGVDADFERVMGLNANGGLGTRTAYGMGAMSFSVPGTTASADASDGPWSYMTTAASNGSEVNGSPPSTSQLQKEWGGAYIFRIKTGPSISTLRIWVGMSSADPAGTDTPDANCMLLRYAPATDGTAFWRFYTDNTGASPEVTATAQSIAVDTAYTFKIVPSASDVKLYVWDGSEWDLLATHTTIPTGAYGPYIVCKTLEAVAKGIKFGFLKIRHK